MFTTIATMIGRDMDLSSLLHELQILYPLDKVPGAISTLQSLELLQAVAKRSPSAGSELGLRWTPTTFAEGPGYLMPALDVAVARIGELTTLPGCPVRCCVAAVRGPVANSFTSSLAVVASGRGSTVADAALGCLAESAERYSLLRFGNEDVVGGSLADLGDSSVSPQLLLLLSEKQYQARVEWNERFPALLHIPAPFDFNRRIEWVVAAADLSTADLAIPAAHGYLGWSSALEDGLCFADSNGCAASPSREAAAVRGFFELIERDAIAIWWYGRFRRPPIDLAALDDPQTQACLTWNRNRHRRVYLTDVTHDFGIPVAAAVAADDNGCHLAFGFAAAPTMVAAVRQALEEMVQFELTLTLRSLSANDAEPWSVLTWSRSAQLREHLYLLPDDDARRVQVTALGQSPEIMLATCHRLCLDRGLDFLAYDMTRSKIRVPVIRVVVPGLRPWWPRFAARGLYDVPFELGWTRSRLREDELNSVPFLY